MLLIGLYSGLVEKYNKLDIFIMASITLLYCYSVIDLITTGNYCGLLFVAFWLLNGVLKLTVENETKPPENFIAGAMVVTLLAFIYNLINAPHVGIFYK
ncbi:MAG: hypothetical protein MJ066_05825 [Clostridia bacterium]|nr:hypothetical protein [Clostridia bacterium]